MKRSMRYSWLLLLSVSLLTSCGGGDGPLSLDELETIEDKLIMAMQKGKLPIYSDNALQNKLAFKEVEALIPLDSADKMDLAGFGVLTQEEMALYNGDFDTESRELAAIGIYILYSDENYEQILPICLASLKDINKVLKGSDQKRFTEYMTAHFNNKIVEYESEIKKLRLEVINETLFFHLNNGELTAYENDNLSSVKSPSELETFMAHKMEQLEVDPNDSNETVMNFVDVPISAQDITHYLPAYDEDENIVAVTMMINENIQGFEINLPWVALDFEEVKSLLKPSMLDYLINHMNNAEEPIDKPALDSLADSTQAS
ncbi:MAG: hypothetical protein JXQ87_06165 [Bacteroidia bacterium]